MVLKSPDSALAVLFPSDPDAAGPRDQVRSRVLWHLRMAWYLMEKHVMRAGHANPVSQVSAHRQVQSGSDGHIKSRSNTR